MPFTSIKKPLSTKSITRFFSRKWLVLEFPEKRSIGVAHFWVKVEGQLSLPFPGPSGFPQRGSLSPYYMLSMFLILGITRETELLVIRRRLENFWTRDERG